MSIVARFGTAIGGGGSAAVNAEEFVYSDLSNKVIGPLANTPTQISEALMWYGGISQFYTTDFTIREVTGGTDPGWYVCLATNSSAPGGGSFTGGSNPATGLSDLLEINDKFSIFYQVEA